MDPLHLEQAWLELLTRDGWIERVERDPQDLHIEWTERGRERGRDFLAAVQALRPEPAWTAEEVLHLRDFGIYLGFVSPTRRDRTRQAFRPFVKDPHRLVISTSKRGHRRFRLFHGKPQDAFYDYVEGEQDDAREVMLISMRDVLESNVGRAFPFGAAGTGGTVWTRGESEDDAG